LGEENIFAQILQELACRSSAVLRIIGEPLHAGSILAPGDQGNNDRARLITFSGHRAQGAEAPQGRITEQAGQPNQHISDNKLLRNKNKGQNRPGRA
jgi:hypothetical protein